MIELVLRAPAAVVEALSDLLMDEVEGLSVSVEDADADTDAEHALFGEPGMPAPAAGWERSTLKALFETERAAEQAATLVLARHGGDGAHVQALHTLASTDVDVACWWATDAAERIQHTVQHLHGGIGADITYPVHRRLLWTMRTNALLGGPSRQLVRLGEALV